MYEDCLSIGRLLCRLPRLKHSQASVKLEVRAAPSMDLSPSVCWVSPCARIPAWQSATRTTIQRRSLLFAVVRQMQINEDQTRVIPIGILRKKITLVKIPDDETSGLLLQIGR